MMKLLRVGLLLCFCSKAMCNGIVASYIRLQWVAEDKFKIVLTLYVDEAANFRDESDRLAMLFKNDEHWKDDGKWFPIGQYALTRISSEKISQESASCGSVTGKSILRDIYESKILFATYASQFVAEEYIIAWNPTTMRLEADDNVINTGGFQEWIMTYVPPLLEGASVRNSSPTFGSLSTFLVCKDDLTSIPLSASDNDADELKFRLSKPFGVLDLHNGTVQTVDLIWANGYSGSNQMGDNSALSIDENTGILTVLPNKSGQYFIGIALDEYRAGKKIGSVNLYYTIVVTECKDNLDLNPQIYQDTTAVTTLTICQGSEATLSSHQSFPDPQPEFQWTRNGKVIWGATAQSISVSEAGEYQLLIRDIDGCPDSFDSQIVHVVVAPSSGAEMDSIPPICDVTVPPVTLNATPSGGTFAGPGIIGNTFDPYIAGVGRHEVVYAVEGSGACPTSQVTRQVVVSETPVLDLTDVLYASRGKPIAIGVKDSLDLAYRWTPPAHLSNDHYANPTSTPVASITYTVTATNEYGCAASQEIKVVISESILIPDAFTPNKDGINETWELKGIEGYPDCRVTIYNRWGTVIFHSVGYKNAFDGMVAGALQMPGVYAYKIKLTESSPELTGSVTLIR